MYEIRACRYPSICSFFINSLYKGDETITTPITKKEIEDIIQKCIPMTSEDETPYYDREQAATKIHALIQPIWERLEKTQKQLNDLSRVIIAIPWGRNMVFDPTNLAASLAARIGAKLEPMEWGSVWYEKEHPSKSQISDKWLAKDE